MAYIFKEDELPSLIDAKGARERIFFVNQELANIDDMLAGVTRGGCAGRLIACRDGGADGLVRGLV